MIMARQDSLITKWLELRIKGWRLLNISHYVKFLTVGLYHVASSIEHTWIKGSVGESMEVQESRGNDIVEERSHLTDPRRTHFFHIHIWNPESV